MKCFIGYKGWELIAQKILSSFGNGEAERTELNNFYIDQIHNVILMTELPASFFQLNTNIIASLFMCTKCFPNLSYLGLISICSICQCEIIAAVYFTVYTWMCCYRSPFKFLHFLRRSYILQLVIIILLR